MKKWRTENKTKWNQYQRNRKSELIKTPAGWATYFAYSLKNRCKRSQIPYELNAEYIESLLPGDMVCPVTSIPLQLGGGKDCENSATLVTFNHSLGYVPGNVAILSRRAASIKESDPDEHVVRFIDWLHTVRPQPVTTISETPKDSPPIDPNSGYTE